MEPPTSLARWWDNGLKRCGGGSRCAVSGRCGDAVRLGKSVERVADSAPRQGGVSLEPPFSLARR